MIRKVKGSTRFEIESILRGGVLELVNNFGVHIRIINVPFKPWCLLISN
jgi:hypothetical protein